MIELPKVADLPNRRGVTTHVLMEQDDALQGMRRPSSLDWALPRASAPPRLNSDLGVERSGGVLRNSGWHAGGACNPDKRAWVSSRCSSRVIGSLRRRRPRNGPIPSPRSAGSLGLSANLAGSGTEDGRLGRRIAHLLSLEINLLVDGRRAHDHHQ
jgi:hypothetical protein